MPRINFNVVATKNDGSPIMRMVTVKDKVRVDEHGERIPEYVLAEDGTIELEPVMVNEILARAVDGAYTGEEGMHNKDRLRRGRIARKVGESGHLAEKDYTDKEIKLIKYCLDKSNAAPSLVAQFQDLIGEPDPAEDEEQEAA
jgi:hypothetical protein